METCLHPSYFPLGCVNYELLKVTDNLVPVPDPVREQCTVRVDHDTRSEPRADVIVEHCEVLRRNAHKFSGEHTLELRGRQVKTELLEDGLVVELNGDRDQVARTEVYVRQRSELSVLQFQLGISFKHNIFDISVMAVIFLFFPFFITTQ